MPDVLTVAAVAALLDCEPDTVEARTRERQLPGLKFGRSWVYPREALLRVLNEQAAAGMVAKPVTGNVVSIKKTKPRRAVPPALPGVV